MSSSTASNATAGSTSLRVIDAQTSAENGRKFTTYKVSVTVNGHESQLWRRYKEFNALNEKVSSTAKGQERRSLF